MGDLEREKEASRVTKLSDMDIHPSLMVIPTYAELQKKRSLKRETIKARFYNVFAPSDPSALRLHTKCTQTSLDYFDNGSEIQLRAELAIKDKVICALKEKNCQTEKMNEKLNRQLIKSSFSHSENDDLIYLKSEVENLNKELKLKDILLVDHEESKKRESQMVGKLAKQHMVILRLTRDLNSIRKRLLDMSKRTPTPQYIVNAKANPKDE